MGLVLIILPFLLGLLGLKRRNPEKVQLEKSIAAGHEERDLSVRGIMAFGIAFLMMMAIALAITTAFEWVFAGYGPPIRSPVEGLANAPQPTLPPEPRLEAVPGQQLEELRAKEDQLLDTYGWIDQKAGIVRIPISRAMDILAQKGLRTRPEAQGKFQDKGNQSPSVSSSGRMMESYP
jgi:hypothetical protein